MKLIFLLLSISASVYFVYLIRSFGYMSIAELKRRSNNKDPLAKKVYKARAYGLQLWIVLWCLYGLALSALILVIEAYLNTFAALVVSVFVIVFMHVLLPWARFPKPSLRMAARVSLLLAKIIHYLRPVLNVVDGLLGSWIEIEGTNRIHSKEELLEVLQRMPGDVDKVGRDEIRIARHALKFGERKISEVMTPRSVTETVDIDMDLTPVNLGELHDSGFSRFPVWRGSRDNLVGILYLKDLSSVRSPKRVEDHMRPEVFYVKDETNLDQVLNAFLRTQHHLFIVVNEYEEIVGVISIEDVLEQIVGKSIIDEFDQYSDLREVAKQKADELTRNRSTGSQKIITK